MAISKAIVWLHMAFPSLSRQLLRELQWRERANRTEWHKVRRSDGNERLGRLSRGRLIYRKAAASIFAGREFTPLQSSRVTFLDAFRTAGFPCITFPRGASPQRPVPPTMRCPHSPQSNLVLVHTRNAAMGQKAKLTHSVDEVVGRPKQRLGNCET
jgi:hypothetical protein